MYLALFSLTSFLVISLSVTIYRVTNMFAYGLPWQIVSTEPHLPVNLAILLEPCQAPCFTLTSNWTRGEFEVVLFGIFLTGH